jgi:hypothetical protein
MIVDIKVLSVILLFMTPLIQSFESLIASIRRSQCVWVKGDKGWYHTYDKSLVTDKILSIRATIDYLEDKHA